jgi:hypothetical protein
MSSSSDDLHPTIVDLNRDDNFLSGSDLGIDWPSPAREQDSIWLCTRGRWIKQFARSVTTMFHSRATRLLD